MIRAVTVGAVRGAVLATGTFAAVTSLIIRRVQNHARS